MTVISMPATPAFSNSSFGLVSNTQVHESPLNREVQTLELTGARWAARYELPTMYRAQAAAWQAFAVRLGGRAGRFYAYDPDAKQPRGSALSLGSPDGPEVAGAGQTGKTLLTRGWQATETGLLLPGDYIQVGIELKMVVEPVNSDSGGEATIEFSPSLRASPADGATIIVSNPVCVMRLVDDDQANWSADQVSRYGISFSAIEAFS